MCHRDIEKMEKLSKNKLTHKTVNVQYQRCNDKRLYVYKANLLKPQSLSN